VSAAARCAMGAPSKVQSHTSSAATLPRGSQRGKGFAIDVRRIRSLVLAVAALGGLVAGASLAGAESQPPDRSPHLLLVPETARAGAALERSSARTIARYDAFTLVEARGKDDAALRIAGADRRDDMRKVSLPGGEFDPLRRGASLADKGAAEPSEALAVVQFDGPVKDGWLARLRESGARIVQYVAQNGYLVHASGTEVDRLAALVGTDPAVRAVTRVTGEDKTSGDLAAGADPRLVAVQTLAGAEGADARRVAEAAGRSVRGASTVDGLTTQFVSLSGAEIDDLAADPAVVAIMPYSTPRLLDERSAQIVAGNLSPVEDPRYLDWLNSNGFGAGTFPFAIDVTDTGLDNGSAAPGHADFYANGAVAGGSRVAYAHDWTGDGSARDCGGHGTNVASIAAGYGVDSNPQQVDPNREDAEEFLYGMGAAPRARLGASKIFDCDGNFELGHADGFRGVAAAAYAAGARISNNSWGYATQLGPYTPDAQMFDSLVRDAHPGMSGDQEMVEVFAAGNEGGRGWATVTAPGTAKNVITVGASESRRPLGRITCGVDDGGADRPGDIVNFSSRGPTDDGRLKPDLVAPGTRLVGAAPQTGGLYEGFGVCQKFFPTGNPLYSMESGTSQAAAAVSGTAALIRSWYRRVHGGNSVVPSPALTKAILVDSATDLAAGDDGKGDLTAPAPNVDQGWGRAHLGAALDGTVRQYVDQSVILDESGQDRFAESYSVQDASLPLKVTLAWTDAPGMVGSTAFVNNLDLVVRQGGRTYKGNVLAGGRSITGGDADPRNNVESVVLPGASGRFSVEVIATSIGGDGVPENADLTDQEFALVVSNAGAQGPSPSLVPEAVSIRDPQPGDNDGFLEPTEPFLLDVSLRNGGDASAGNVSGTMSGAGLAFDPAPASWGSIPQDAVAAAGTPFEGTLAPTASCGADVPATLGLTTSQGPQTVPVTLPTGEPGVPATSAAGPSKAIPDNYSAGVASTIQVTTPGRVKDLDVAVSSLAHPYVGDLGIEVTSPAGTTVTLARHPGGPDNAGDNFTGTVFDDEAGTNISAGTAPYTGRFKPQNDQLSRFDGEQRQGTWTLRVRDLSEGDVGSLTSWHTTTRRAICDFTDHVAPETAITSGPVGTTSSRTASFNFTSTESGSIFECSLDGGPPTACEPPHTVAGLGDGTHRLRVQARDLADNLDPSAAEWSWTVDTTAPAVTLATPRPGALLREAQPQLSGSGGLAPGDAGTVTVKLWRGSAAGGQPAQTLSVARDPASGTWSTRPATLADGAWTARVEQSDAVGNVGVSAPVTFTVSTAVIDNTAPDFAIVPAESDLAGARAGRLTLLAGCGSACRVSAELRSAGRRPQLLGRARASLAAQRSKALRLKLTRKGRAALRGVFRRKARLLVTVDGAGPPLRLDQALVLRKVDPRRVARRGLPLAARCSEQCSVAASLLMNARDARRHGLRAPGGRSVPVGGGASSSATTARLVVRVRQSSRKVFRSARRLNVTLQATVQGPSGPRHRVSHPLTLRH
jgi:subtilisin-like proprotein convertase family protein